MDIRVSSKIERTDREWLSWALKFAQADLNSWPERDWLSTMKEALAFGASRDEATHAQLPLTMCAPVRRYNLSLRDALVRLRTKGRRVSASPVMPRIDDQRRGPAREQLVLGKGVALRAPGVLAPDALTGPGDPGSVGPERTRVRDALAFRRGSLLTTATIRSPVRSGVPREFISGERSP